MRRSPTDYISIFDRFTDEKLNKPQRVLKIIGKIASTIAVVAYISFKVTGIRSETIWANIESTTFIISAVIGILAFTGMALYSYGKQQGQPKLPGALKLVMKKVFLYMFLPAIIFTGILYLLFVSWR